MEKLLLFVWVRVEHATKNYHSQGALVVIAATEKRARELAGAQPDVSLSPNEAPEIVGVMEAASERVFVFPDVGCC